MIFNHFSPLKLLVITSLLAIKLTPSIGHDIVVEDSYAARELANEDLMFGRRDIISYEIEERDVDIMDELVDRDIFSLAERGDDNLPRLNRRAWTCPNHCGYTLQTSGGLNDQLVAQQHAQQCPNAVVSCPHCHHNCRRNQLNAHYGQCQSYPVQCPNCHAQMQRQQYMNTHRFNCHKCEQCGRVFTTGNGLATHMRSHNR